MSKVKTTSVSGTLKTNNGVNGILKTKSGINNANLTHKTKSVAALITPKTKSVAPSSTGANVQPKVNPVVPSKLNGTLPKSTINNTSAKTLQPVKSAANGTKKSNVATNSVLHKSAASMKSDANVASMKSDAKVRSMKSDAKIASMKSDTKIASMKSDVKIASMKSDAKVASMKSDAKIASMNSDAKIGPVKSTLASTSVPPKTSLKRVAANLEAQLENSQVKRVKRIDSKSTDRKSFDMPGQRKETPDELDVMRMFYTSLYKERPSSKMAQKWCLEHGLLKRAKAEALVAALSVEKAKKKSGSKQPVSSIGASLAKPAAASKPLVKKKVSVAVRTVTDRAKSLRVTKCQD